MTLKDRIIYQLEKQNLSKADLIRLSGVKKSTIYTFFQRNTELQLDTLRPIATALAVSLEYLIYGKEGTKPNKASYIQELYDALSPISQAEALGIFEAILIKENNSLDIEKIIKEHQISKLE